MFTFSICQWCIGTIRTTWVIALAYGYCWWEREVTGVCDTLVQDLGTPRPLLSIHQSGASGVHTAAAEGWHANADYTGQHYVLIRSPHRTNKYCPYTIHNTVTVRIRNLEYLDTYITINNLETCFFFNHMEYLYAIFMHALCKNDVRPIG